MKRALFLIVLTAGCTSAALTVDGAPVVGATPSNDATAQASEQPVVDAGSDSAEPCSIGPAHTQESVSQGIGLFMVKGAPACTPRCGASPDADGQFHVDALPSGPCTANAACAMGVVFDCDGGADEGHSVLCTCWGPEWSCAPNDGEEYACRPMRATVPAPVLHPKPDAYPSCSLQITIDDTDTSATIFYTTDGSPPTTASSRYVGLITAEDDVTVRALAVREGFVDSDVVEGTYALAPPVQTMAPPTFDPPDGTKGAESVTVTSLASGATICFTDDGSAPSCTDGVCDPGSFPYPNGSAFDVSGATVTLRALVCKGGACAPAPSPVTEATYTP